MRTKNFLQDSCYVLVKELKGPLYLILNPQLFWWKSSSQIQPKMVSWMIFYSQKVVLVYAGIDLLVDSIYSKELNPGLEKPNSPRFHKKGRGWQSHLSPFDHLKKETTWPSSFNLKIPDEFRLQPQILCNYSRLFAFGKELDLFGWIYLNQYSLAILKNLVKPQVAYFQFLG